MTQQLRWCAGICVFLALLSSPQAGAPPQSAIATAHPLATAAGQDILAAGGNAFDAAVAISAVLAVVEPFSSGLGGGGFWLLYEAGSGRYTMIDGRETAPAAAHRDMYLDKQGKLDTDRSLNGPLAAAIPGLPAALVHLAQHYGKLPLTRSLAPAIAHARDGFAVSRQYQRMANMRQDVFNRWPDSADIFLQDGLAPEAGFRLRQPDLARTLQLLADQGRAGYYEGDVARRLVEGVRADGGIWSLDDLRQYQVKERVPVQGNYQGMTIVSAALPSSGGVTLLETLNILARFDLAKAPGITQKHLVIEALRRAYRDRAQFLGDPDFSTPPLQRLLSPDYAAGLAAGIDRSRATASSRLPPAEPPQQGDHTTHFSLQDAAGNRVAATLSINFAFGAAYVPPGTGVLLNDEMDDFSAQPGAANAYGLVGYDGNAIAAGKRPLSSMAPTMIDGPRGAAILGTPGGSRIISMVLLGVLEYARGGDAAAMVASPRYHHQYLPDEVQYETNGLTPQEIKTLQQLGHTTQDVGRTYGDMQVVVWERKSGRISAASDPRREGLASVR